MRRLSPSFVRVLTIAVAVASAGHAGAQVTISTLPASSGGFTNGNSTGVTFGQSFRTPDATNVRLTQFQFYVGAASANVAAAARVFTFNPATTVVGTLLAEQAFVAPVATTPETTVLTPFSFNLTLLPGTDYLFAVSYSPAAGGAFTRYQTPGYAAGGAYYATAASTVAQLQATPLTGNSNPAGFDYAFSATFNPAVAAVPEPGTWALLATGLAGLGLVARRRRRA